MENPLISIIVPVYNVELYLDDCIESVCNQTYTNLEIIMVDDGSKDSSSSMCDNWAEKDERIIVIHKINGGLSDARNAGLDIAKGKYVMFVDSDDTLSLNIVEYLFDLIKENKADISICDPVHCYPHRKVNYTDETKKIVYKNVSRAVSEMLYQKSFLVSAWGKLYDFKCFDKIRFPTGMLFEDSAVMYRVYYEADTIVYGNAKKYGYMHRENSITTRKFTKRDLDILEISKDILNYAENKLEILPAAKAYFITANLRIFLNANPENEFREVIKKCKENIKKYYFSVFFDSNIRNKLRISLILFLLGRKTMIKIHNQVDRWK